MNKPNLTRFGNTEFHWGERTYIMGIINVSPESFSGDGLADIETILEQAFRKKSYDSQLQRRDGHHYH